MAPRGAVFVALKRALFRWRSCHPQSWVTAPLMLEADGYVAADHPDVSCPLSPLPGLVTWELIAALLRSHMSNHSLCQASPCQPTWIIETAFPLHCCSQDSRIIAVNLFQVISSHLCSGSCPRLFPQEQYFFSNITYADQYPGSHHSTSLDTSICLWITQTISRIQMKIYVNEHHGIVVGVG